MVRFKNLVLTPKGEAQCIAPPSVNRITSKVKASDFFQGKTSVSDLNEVITPQRLTEAVQPPGTYPSGYIAPPVDTVEVVWEAGVNLPAGTDMADEAVREAAILFVTSVL